MAQAGFFKQWEEENKALKSPESYFVDAPDRNEGSGKMCSFEWDELQHRSKLQLCH